MIDRDGNFFNGNHNSPPLAFVNSNLDAKKQSRQLLELIATASELSLQVVLF